MLLTKFYYLLFNNTFFHFELADNCSCRIIIAIACFIYLYGCKTINTKINQVLDIVQFIGVVINVRNWTVSVTIVVVVIFLVTIVVLVGIFMVIIIFFLVIVAIFGLFFKCFVVLLIICFFLFLIFVAAGDVHIGKASRTKIDGTINFGK